MKNAKILTVLFWDFIVYNFIFTAAGAYMLMLRGNYSFPYVFWIKLVGFSALSYWYFYYHPRRLYFFYNLGFSRQKLIGISLAMDSFISLIIFVIVYGLTGNR